jgi:hypothetical protein
MSKRLSQGIRIYEHKGRKLLSRDCYNFGHGMKEFDNRQLKAAFLHEPFAVIAIGCEEGAMAVHYKWGR